MTTSRSRLRRGWLWVGAVGFGCATQAFGVGITLTQISTPFNSPIGIDYHEPTNTVVFSVNYASGQPHNFERILANGTHVQFSNASGFTDEVKIATVRSGNVGGFTTGDLFTGNGVDGQIARITNGGGTVVNTWADLPGTGNGLMRGSLYVDRTGVWGGDLLAVTTAGQFWRVNSAGAATTATPLATTGTHLEGLITVPNDAARYGPLAGKAIAGAEALNRLYAFDTAGNVQFFDLGIPIEDIDLVESNANFFGVNFGTGRILGAPASDFAGIVGDILLTQEFPSGGAGLYRLLWNGTSLVPELITLNSGSATVGQWEHVTFAAAGIVEIPPTGAPEPSALALVGAALLAGWLTRRARKPV